METNYDTLRMPDLRALAREHGLRGYSRLRKAELIAFFWDNLGLITALRPPTKPIPALRPPLKSIPAARRPSKPIPAPKSRSPRSVKLQPKRTRPQKPIRPPPLLFTKDLLVHFS